jgi:multidrug efflux pump subunit AcrA (membrane-fusion protein)
MTGLRGRQVGQTLSLRRHLRPSIAGLAVCLLLTACSKEQEKETEPVAPVQVTEARLDAVQRIITADGILRAVDQSAIMPKISAPVIKFYVNRGDHVRKDQVLAVLENRDLAASVTDAKGAYDQAAAAYRNISSATVPDEIVKAESDVQSAKQGLEAAQKLMNSREQLFKEGALARRLVDEAAVAYAQAKSQYDTAQKHLESLQSVARHEEVKSAAGQLESAKGKYEAARAQLSYSEVRSPISGIVADRAVFPGEMATAGSPLLTVVDLSSVIARVNVPQTDAVHLRVGQPATIASTDNSVTLDGKITVVSPAVDPQTTTVEIWVQAVNKGERLRPGGTIHVTINAGALPNTVVVPPAALLPSQEGGTAVMVVTPDSVAHQHSVKVGVRNEDKVQILEGVKPGERVVVAGGVGLQDGAKVKIQATGEGGEKSEPAEEKKSGEK